MFLCNISWKEFKGSELINNEFWKKVVQTWFTENKARNTITNIYLEPIFNNVNITYNSKPLFFKSVIGNNISYVKDICVGRRILTFQEFKEKCTENLCSFIEYFAIYKSINRERLGTDDPNNREEKHPTFMSKRLGQLKSKGFKELIAKSEPNNSFTRWSRKFSINLSDNVWALAYECTKEVRLRVLHWKIVNNIYPTNILLHKMRVRESVMCQYCSVPDYLEHFFIDCKIVQPLWREVEGYLSTLINIPLHLEPAEKLVGLINNKCNKDNTLLINKVILITKMCISKYKYGTNYDLISTFYFECFLRKIFFK